jgi:hypothetical protein
VGGFIVPETLRERGGLLQTSDARLDSYGRLQLGALVPVTESDFGCCGPLFGGELACPRPSSTPPESLCRDRQPSRAWPIQKGESMPWQSASNPPSSDYKVVAS